MTAQYNDPAGGTPSSVGGQIRTDAYIKKALYEVQKEQYFTQLADTTSMPKNMGKTIKRYHYLPILDDSNLNDQGIDANGVGSDDAFVEKTIIIKQPEVTSTGNGHVWHYAVGNGVDAAAALTAAQATAVDIFKNLGIFDTDYATTVAAIEALTPAWVVDTTPAVVPHSGNLYGSSKDVGTILGKIPVLSESGGRVNRVGATRIELEASIEKRGIFEEYTKESVDFDTDAELQMHINRELLNAANELTEDELQIDLLSGAGVILYGGDATSTAEITGEAGTPSVVSYENLMRLGIILDENRCPKHTKIITGTRMIDTKTVDAARILYIGTEMIPTIRRMKDLFNNQAFIDVRHYAAGTTILRGEIGAVDQFRIVVVPEMAHWAAAGGAVTTNTGYRESGGKYNVYPMLVVGDQSFTTIGFQTDGKSVKFKIKHSTPESNTAYSADDPYGEKGFYSIKWYRGTMILRPERIALVKAVAEM